MRAVFLVFLGGGMGSVVRYGLSVWLARAGAWTGVATFFANITACFLIGIVAANVQKGNWTEETRWIWATGFCGGLSTFSTFTNETLFYLEKGNWTGVILGGGYLAVSLVVGLAATWLGWRF